AFHADVKILHVRLCRGIQRLFFLHVWNCIFDSSARAKGLTSFRNGFLRISDFQISACIKGFNELSRRFLFDIFACAKGFSCFFNYP
ncbi:hypothetical protein LQF61_09165, partial [Tetragenococcus koreensis]|uniref:hypothetical protein n=1 Tax=Tetragenococcus koreensis TaxID=290335 RepID=UPI001F213AFB